MTRRRSDLAAHLHMRLLEKPDRVPDVDGKWQHPGSCRWVVLVGSDQITLILENENAVPVASMTDGFPDVLAQGAAPATADKLVEMAGEILDWVKLAVDLQDALGAEIRLDQIRRGTA